MTSCCTLHGPELMSSPAANAGSGAPGPRSAQPRSPSSVDSSVHVPLHHWKSGTTPQGIADPDKRFTRYTCWRCGLSCDYYYNRENNGLRPGSLSLQEAKARSGPCKR